MKIFVALLLGLCAWSATGLHFKTSMDESQWISDASPYSCRLEHYISGYGVGSFVHNAGENRHLVLNGQGIRFDNNPAEVRSLPPQWRPGERAIGLSRISPKQGEVNVGEVLATSIATELLRGMMVSFRGELEGSESQPLEVDLSTVGFREAFDDFTVCEDQLLPASFSQLERIRILYQAGEIELSAKAETTLQKVVTFLETDNTVKQIFIDGHTDDTGLTRDNVSTSKRRAELVRDYLVSAGVPESILVVRYHAEKYPVVQNSSSANRAKNRRTTVRLSREFKPQPDAIASAEQTY